MTAQAFQIAEVRRNVKETDSTNYSDTLIQAIIEAYPMIDELGTSPYYYEQTGATPVKIENDSWIPTYDLNMACAQIWREKAASVASHFDFSADGGDYTQSQEYTNADAMARFFLARSSSKTIKQVIAESTNENPIWIGNLPEE